MRYWAELRDEYADPASPGRLDKPRDPTPAGLPPGVSGDLLSRQAHYTTLTPEPINVIEGWGLDFYLGNAIKYIARAGRKPGEPATKDLEKAIRYLRRKVNAIAGRPSWD